jgi:hypothetical protein
MRESDNIAVDTNERPRKFFLAWLKMIHTAHPVSQLEDGRPFRFRDFGLSFQAVSIMFWEVEDIS